MTYALRVLKSYPWDASCHGNVSGEFDTRDDADEVRRAMPNGQHFEVVEIGGAA